MKKITLLAVAVMMAICSFAQDKLMKVYKGNSVVAQEFVNNIDSIVFVDFEVDPSLFYVEDVFTISGRGTVVTGVVIKGGFKKGQTVGVVTINEAASVVTSATIAGLEMFKKEVEEVVEGDNVGILFGTDIDKTAFPRGTAIIAAENSPYIPATKITGDMYVLTKEEGGRHTPFSLGYSPQLYIGTSDVTVKCTNLGTVDGAAVELVMPGSNTVGTEWVLNSEGYRIIGYVGQKVAIREGGRTVAEMTITKLE